MNRTLAPSVLALSLLAVGGFTSYVDTSFAADVATDEARRRFLEGVEHYDAKRFAQARASFLQAYALRRHPDIAVNIGFCAYEMGQWMEAYRYLDGFLKDPSGKAAMRSDAEQKLRVVKTKLGRLDISAPAGAELLIDGERVGFAPIEPLYVEPGIRSLEIRDAAGKQLKTFQVAAGQKLVMKIGQGASAVPSTSAPRPTPSAVVVPSASSSSDSSELPPKKAASSSIWDPPVNMIPVYVAGGIALAGLGTGLLFGVIFKNQATSNNEEIEREIRAKAGGSATGVCVNPTSKYAAACQAIVDNNMAIDTDATVGNVGLAIGLSALVGGALYYFLATKPKAEDKSAAKKHEAFWSPSIVPVVGPRGGGLVVRF